MSNRGVASDSVAVLRFDASDGTLELASQQSTYGREPRSWCSPPAETACIVANQDDDSIIVFAFDETSGTHEQLSVNAVPTPVCLQVV